LISAMGMFQDVEILAANQVQEQIEGPLEGLEKHLERLRRDIQIARHLRQPARH